jgi:hypothetical protein
MFKYDLVNYISKGAVGFGLLSVYDVFVENRSFSGFASRDALSFTVAIVGSEWFSDVLSHMIDMNNNSISGMISKPLLVGIIYMYMFNYLVRPEYETTRDNTNLFLMGSLSSVLLRYASNPILSLFGLLSECIKN